MVVDLEHHRYATDAPPKWYRYPPGGAGVFVVAYLSVATQAARSIRKPRSHAGDQCSRPSGQAEGSGKQWGVKTQLPVLTSHCFSARASTLHRCKVASLAVFRAGIKQPSDRRTQ